MTEKLLVRTMVRTILSLAVILSPLSLGALELAGIFGDHMVLQRDKPVLVWGRAAPGTLVQVRFGLQQVATRTDAHGSWEVVLKSMPANSIPGELMVWESGTSATEIVLRDVLVGEVWLCSGQSNMFWPIGAITNQRSSWPGVLNGEREVADANWPLIRLNFEEDHEFGLGGWLLCKSEYARGFSATAYFFGRELHQHLDVPIGLLVRSRGGTSLQAWMPRRALEGVPFVRKHLLQENEYLPVVSQWNRDMAAFRKAQRLGSAPGHSRPEALPDEMEIMRRLQSRGELHERYIVPLARFSMRGHIWYQGESNAAPQALAAAYGEMLEGLIAARRELWGEPALPFYFVQLPVYNHPINGRYWHYVREGMRRAQQRTVGSGMVVTYDFSDPNLLHPPEKQEVGRRLALWALASDYGRPIGYSGPLFRKALIANGVAEIHFYHGAGLQSSDGKELRGFEMAGPDGQFRPVTAEIRGDVVILTSPEVPAPQEVRFFFGTYDLPNLINETGLPASGFTTEAL